MVSREMKEYIKRGSDGLLNFLSSHSAPEYGYRNVIEVYEKYIASFGHNQIKNSIWKEPEQISGSENSGKIKYFHSRTLPGDAIRGKEPLSLFKTEILDVGRRFVRDHMHKVDKLEWMEYYNLTPPPPGLDYYKKTDGELVGSCDFSGKEIYYDSKSNGKEKYFYSVGNLTDKKNIVGDFWLSIPEGIKLGLLKLDGEPFTEEEITEFRTNQPLKELKIAGKIIYGKNRKRNIQNCIDEKIENVRPNLENQCKQNIFDNHCKQKCINKKIENVLPNFENQCNKEIDDEYAESSIKIQRFIRNKGETKKPPVVNAVVVDGAKLVNNDKTPVAIPTPIPTGGKRRHKSHRRRKSKKTKRRRRRKSRRRRQKPRKSRRRRKSKKTKRRRRRK